MFLFFLYRISSDLSFIHRSMAYDSAPCEECQETSCIDIRGMGTCRRAYSFKLGSFQAVRSIQTSLATIPRRVTCSFCSNTDSLVQSLCVRVEYRCNHGLQAQVSLRKQSQFAKAIEVHISQGRAPAMIMKCFLKKKKKNDV